MVVQMAARPWSARWTASASVHCGSMLLAKAIAVVDDEDVQDAQVQARQEIGECRVGFERVHVRVDRLDGGEPGRGCRMPRLRPGE